MTAVRIYRRQPANFNRPYAALYGTKQRGRKAFIKRSTLCEPRSTIAQTLSRGTSKIITFTLLKEVSRGAVRFDALIAACGATDRLMPGPGLNRGLGVYSLGAAQIALKSQACAIGQKVVFAGTGPLLYLVASQYVKAGAQVAAVLDTSKAGLRLEGVRQTHVSAEHTAEGHSTHIGASA